MAKTAAADKAKDAAPKDLFAPTMRTALLQTAGIAALLGFNAAVPDPSLLQLLTTFGLAGVVGYQVVWGVAHSLHSPLMSVTNAVSGLTAVGGVSDFLFAHCVP